VRKVCAWCGKAMDGPEAEVEAEAPISHGICKACKAQLLGEAGVPLQEFLSSLDAPVLLVSGNMEVESVSRQPFPWTEEETVRVRGLLGGEVFQCSNARAPGGCGRTLKCTSCAIRGSVEHTHSTGQALFAVPATLTTGPEDHETTIDLLVSTQKVGDRVLLKIEGI